MSFHDTAPTPVLGLINGYRDGMEHSDAFAPVMHQLKFAPVLRELVRRHRWSMVRLRIEWLKLKLAGPVEPVIAIHWNPVTGHWAHGA